MCWVGWCQSIERTKTKIKFESKSQLNKPIPVNPVIERTKTKIKFESKSQQTDVANAQDEIERTKTKIKFESKSQPGCISPSPKTDWKN